MRIGSEVERALLRIGPVDDAEAIAVLDPDAQVVPLPLGGYEVTAGWTPMTFRSDPDGGRITLGQVGLAVNFNDLIEACLASPDRTCRLADLPQIA